MHRTRVVLVGSLLTITLAVGSTPAASGAPPPSGAAPETVAPETILGADGRARVTPTTAFPHRAIGKISAVFDGQSFGCTGYLIAADFILTAAHCVFFDDGTHETGDGVREEPESFTFSAGRDDTEFPYGTCQGIDFFYTQDWQQVARPRQDYAGVRLDCDIGNTTGVFGLAVDSDRDEYTGDPARLFGYPVTPPTGPSRTLWGMKDRIERSQKRMLFVDLDGSGGQSGVPVFNYQNPAGPLPAGYYAMAVYTYGAGLSYSPCVCNAATRITPARLGLIQQWMGG